MGINKMNFKCNKCLKTIGLEEGVLCKLLLIKPWEIAKKSQSSIHYYLVLCIGHVKFEDNRCAYIYFLVPTTTDVNLKNDSRLMIDSKDWYDSKDVIIKLDELFILQDFDFKIWITENRVSDIWPQLMIDNTINKWKLLSEKVWEKIKFKLFENLFNNRVMFFILNRKIFQKNNNYWKKQLRSNHIYTTDAFIPEYNSKLDLFFNTIMYDIENIRINEKFNIKKMYIDEYKKNHFKNNELKKIKRFEFYFKNKTID